MKDPIADVMIHLDETMSRDQLAELEESLKENEYIISADVPEGKEHMILVTYNAEEITAKDILDRVTTRGVNAELVGL